MRPIIPTDSLQPEAALCKAGGTEGGITEPVVANNSTALRTFLSGRNGHCEGA
jgi:hypothetical protein